MSVACILHGGGMQPELRKWSSSLEHLKELIEHHRPGSIYKGLKNVALRLE